MINFNLIFKVKNYKNQILAALCSKYLFSLRQLEEIGRRTQNVRRDVYKAHKK